MDPAGEGKVRNRQLETDSETSRWTETDSDGCQRVLGTQMKSGTVRWRWILMERSGPGSGQAAKCRED